MPDRLAEIRARLDAATRTERTNAEMVWDSDKAYHMEDNRDRASQAFHQHAPADIAWLLDELKRLREYTQHDELCDLTRGVAPPVCCTCGLNEEKYGIHDD